MPRKAMEKRKPQTYRRYERSEAPVTIELGWKGTHRSRKTHAAWKSLLRTRHGLSEITDPDTRSDPRRWEPLRERVRQIVNRAGRTLQHDLALSRLHLLFDLGAEVTRWIGDRETGQPLRIRDPMKDWRFVQRLPDAFLTVKNQGREIHWFLEVELEAPHRARKRALMEERFFVYAKCLKDGTLPSRERGAEAVPVGQLVGLRGNPPINVLFVALTRATKLRYQKIAAFLRLDPEEKVEQLLDEWRKRHARATRSEIAKRERVLRERYKSCPELPVTPFWFTSLEDIVVHRVAGDARTGRERTVVDYEASADRLVNEDVLVGLNGRPSRLLA